MPFVPVPKDLTKVKTKVAFNLTKRQLVCFSLGGLAGVSTYLMTKGSIGIDSAALLMIVLMAPFFLFGIYEKDGQPLEKVLKNYISVKFRRPPNRPYRTENGYAALVCKKMIEGRRVMEGRGLRSPSGSLTADNKSPVQK